MKDGQGSSDYKTKSNAAITRDNLLNNMLNQGYGYEVFSNMDRFDDDSTGVTYAGSYSVGTKGASKKSLILQPDATITISGRNFVRYVDFMGTKSPTSGKLEVYRGSVLQKTHDFYNSTEIDNQLTFTAVQNVAESSENIVIKCINAPVEIYGIYTLNAATYAININRIATSGYATSDYVDNIDAIVAIGKFYNKSSIFLLALGTNDIYSAGKAITSGNFKTNLQTIIDGILLDNENHIIVLTIPPLADENIFPPIYEPHTNYRDKIYELSKEYGLGVIDYSEIDFVGNGWLADGVHPNDNGHLAYSRKDCEELCIPFLNTLPQKNLKQLVIPIDDFTPNGANMQYFSTVISRYDYILNIYLKNKTNGLTVPYNEYTDYPNEIGLYMQRAYGTDYTIKFYYITANGFCVTGRGPLGSLVSNTASDCELVIEYIDSSW